MMGEVELVVRPATKEQIRVTWANTCAQWGRGLPEADYFAREELLASMALNEDNRFIVWVLVPKGDEGTVTDIKCHLETMRRPVTYKPAGSTEVVRSWFFAICTVFTPVGNRKKGYITKMFELLLEGVFADQSLSIGSVLYSEVGKFYERFNYRLVPHHPISMAAVDMPIQLDTGMSWLTESDIRGISKLDQQSIDLELVNSQSSSGVVSMDPNFNTYEWHFARSKFYARYFNQPQPQYFGLEYCPPPSSSSNNKCNREFVIWLYDYSKKEIIIVRHRITDNGPALISNLRRHAHAVGFKRVTGWNLNPAWCADHEVLKEDVEDSLPYILLNRPDLELDWVNVQKFSWA